MNCVEIFPKSFAGACIASCLETSHFPHNLRIFLAWHGVPHRNDPEHSIIKEEVVQI